MQILEKNDKAVVQADGELDLSNAQDLRNSLQQAIEQSNSDVVLDLREAIYIDSAVLQELIRAHNLLSKQDRQFIVLANPSTQPGQVLHTVMFHTIMKVCGSWEELMG